MTDVVVRFSSSNAAVRTSVIALAPDASKKSRVVRAADAGDVGHLTWLKLTDAYRERNRLSSACDEVTIDIGGVTMRKTITPPLPKSAHAQDVVQRQFGSLRAHGAAVQLRFGAYAAADQTFALLDGAVTIDATHPTMEACAPMLGEIAENGARALGSRVVSVGKNPDVWNPRPLASGDDGYVKGQIEAAYDWRGKERHEAALEKLTDDLGAYVPTRSEAGPLVEKVAERDRFGAALQAKIETLHHVRDGLIRGECGRISDDDPSKRIVCAETIEQAYESCAIINPTSGERVGVRDCGVYLDDIAGLDAREIDAAIARVRNEAAIARVVLRSMFDELRGRVEWDNLESGVETRDVLENGVRREHMEKLLGREVTKADVDASLKIPARIRAKIVGGYDVEASRMTGRYIADVGARARIADS